MWDIKRKTLLALYETNFEIDISFEMNLELTLATKLYKIANLRSNMTSS